LGRSPGISKVAQECPPWRTNPKGTPQTPQCLTACGTGTTYTFLKMVEKIVPIGGCVLFLAPSIAKLQ
jgi:primosomal protein N'